MINHLTIHVEPGTLTRPDLTSFFSLLGFEEIEPNDRFEHGWEVRWFRQMLLPGAVRLEALAGIEPLRPPYIHLVETDDGEHDIPALGHFCVSGLGLVATRTRAAAKGWLERDSGSGRIWLRLANIRVEVRS